LLGKRVDYSGRSVIVVGPQLRINECGLPYDMARELFQPFLINQLLKTKITPPSHNTKLANVIIKKNKPFIWTLLKNLILEHSILLNRAPTLHRFGIQAFDPVIILGQAIHLHPLVCTGFNADFDGDQMAVHLPLYQSSQLEAKTMMRPSYNLLSPSNGEVILKPTQDMVIGCYYLTFMISRNNFCFQKIFSNEKEALIAFHQKKLSIHTSILIRYLVENSDFRIQKNKLIFSRKIKNHVFSFFDKEVFIHKIFALGKENLKYFFITNLGIILAYRFNVDQYKLTEIFLETSPGRLLFSHNFQNSLN
jgi:DNA-directed RNA polymerase subunit beta'